MIKAKRLGFVLLLIGITAMTVLVIQAIQREADDDAA